MKGTQTKNLRILAIAPSSRGFGFAVFDAQGNLESCGVKSTNGNKNIRCVSKLQEMINDAKLGVLVLEDASAEGSRRSKRIRNLSNRMIALAVNRKLRVKTLPRKKWRQVFFGDDEGTKEMVAEILAQRFPIELGPILPPERKLWMSEDYQMPAFDAVALGLAFHGIKINPKIF